jgi:hypothetical protein
MWTLVDNEDIKVGDRVRFLGALEWVDVLHRTGDSVHVKGDHLYAGVSFTIQEEDRFERWEEPVQAEEAPTATDWVKCDLSTLSPGSPIVRTNNPATLENNPRVLEFVDYDPYTQILSAIDPTDDHVVAYYVYRSDTYYTKRDTPQASTEWVKCDLSTLSPGSPIVRTNNPADLENDPKVFEFVEYYPDLKIAEVRNPINGYTSAYYDNEQFTFYTKRTLREPRCPAPKVIDDYPHTCYHCGSPAYVGEYGIDCKGKCEASK